GHTILVSDWSSDVCSSDLASRCDHLRIASGGDVPEPKALLPILEVHVHNIFPVGRNGGAVGIAVVRQLREAHVAEWQRTSSEKRDRKSVVYGNRGRVVGGR